MGQGQRKSVSKGEEKAKREKTKKVFKRIAITICVLLLISILALAGLGIAFIVTDGFGGRIDTLIVGFNNEIYTESGEGLRIYPNEEMKVQSLTGKGYTVTIEASDKADFSFEVAGDKNYRWVHIATNERLKDVTKAFKITPTDSGFTVGYEQMEGILRTIYGSNDVKVPEGTDLSGEYFVLIIVCGKREVRLGFGVGVPVSGVEINPPNIGFPKGIKKTTNRR